MSAQPRLVVSAPSSGHGKTAIAVGLLAACAARGIPAAGFKVGPDHTDAAYLGLAAGRPGRNLDPRLVGAQRIAPLFGHGAAGAKLSVIEGAMGLFDSLTGQPEVDGTAAVAATLRAPVVLVVDVATMGHSLAALVHGFRMFDEMVHLGGVILNRVASPRHEQMLRTALDDIGMPVLGALRRGDLPNVLPARAHGPVPVAHRTVEASRAVRRLGEAVAGSLDLERLMALAGAAPALPAPIWTPADAVGGEIFEQRPLVALAGGPGAPYTYVETAELLTAAGADVAVVDPLRDETLPAGTRALIVGAGLPEGYAEELSANRRLCNTVAKFAHDGWPVVAEGVALPWLARDFDGRPMCAVFDASAVTGEQTVAGYREATAPTTSPLAPAGARITGYKQHRAIMTPRAGAVPAWTWSGGTPEGFVWRQVHASQLGLHWAAAPEIAKRVVAAAIAGPAGSAHPPTAVLIGQIIQPGHYDAPAPHAAAGHGAPPVLQGQIIMPNRPDPHGSPIPFDASGPHVVYDVAGSPGSRSAAGPEVYYDPRGTEIIYDATDTRIVYDVPDASSPEAVYDPPSSRGSQTPSGPPGSPAMRDSFEPQDHRDAPRSRGYDPSDSRDAQAFGSRGSEVPYDSPGSRVPHDSPYGSPARHDPPAPYDSLDPHDPPGPYDAPDPHDSRDLHGSPDPHDSRGPYGSPDLQDAPRPRGTQIHYDAPGPPAAHESSVPRAAQNTSGSPVFGEPSGPHSSKAPFDASGSPAVQEPSGSRGAQGPYGSPVFGEASGSRGSQVSFDASGSPAAREPSGSRGSQAPFDAPGSPAERDSSGSRGPYGSSGSQVFGEASGSRGSRAPYDPPGSPVSQGPTGSRGAQGSYGPSGAPGSPAFGDSPGLGGSYDSSGAHSPQVSYDSPEPHGSPVPHGPRESQSPYHSPGSPVFHEDRGPRGSQAPYDSPGPRGPGDSRESFGPGGLGDSRESFGPGGSADPREVSRPHGSIDPRELFEPFGPADPYGQAASNGPFPPGSPHEPYAPHGRLAPHGPAAPASPYPQAAGTSRPQPVPAGRPGPVGDAAEPVNLADTADIITS